MKFYMQFDENGRMSLGKEEPKKPELLIKVIEAETWKEAKNQVLTSPSLDPYYVEGFDYIYGHGYFKEGTWNGDSKPYVRP